MGKSPKEHPPEQIPEDSFFLQFSTVNEVKEKFLIKLICHFDLLIRIIL
jgi:hypothetical protein